MQKVIKSKQIVSERPPKNQLNVFEPYEFIHEDEMQADGIVKKVNTIFLTNSECPFKCVMCDLWRNTIDKPTPEGAIPAQIEYALSKLPDADVIKLYNSGNFFDGKAIPRSDYIEIARLLSSYAHVIVENHPKLIGPFIGDFENLLHGSLEIAMGLETIHPVVLPKLNKQITTDNFREAVCYLNKQGISSRAFILLNPPFLTDADENIEWCYKSVKFAFNCGVSSCSVIPTRAGNGIMDKLMKFGQFVSPELSALEQVFEMSLKLNSGRVFCDTWDLEKFSDCKHCLPERKERLHKMNLTQEILPPVSCECKV